MSPRLWRRTPPVLAAAALLALALGAGCKKEEEYVPNPKGNPMPNMAKGGAGPKMPPQGEILFGQKGCGKCHSVGAQDVGPRKKKGPDLATVGADPAHTPEWFAEYIRNPRSKNPESKMPPHDESKINDQEMATLVKYLGGLK